MNLNFIIATENDADIVGQLVLKLTEEICNTTQTQHFDIDLMTTTHQCRELLQKQQYGAIIGFASGSGSGQPIAIATFTESYALYAGGKLGIIPEFYVDPAYRSSGIGSKLMTQIKDYGATQGWNCIELCTPPLPEFEKSLLFYQKNGLVPVGGRKMRQYL